MPSFWQTVRHPLDTIDRKIVEAQTCPGCGCNGDQWRENCDCLRQGCPCAGAEEDDNPDWEREPGPDAVIVDAAAAPVDLPPTAPIYVPASRCRLPRSRTHLPSPDQQGAAAMPSIEEARAGVMKAHQDGQSALAALGQAHEMAEDTQNAFRHATEGSNQPEADQAHGQLAEAVNKIDEARQQISAALAEFEGVAQRL